MSPTSTIPNKPYLKTTEVARIFDVNRSTVFLWVKKHKLRAHRTLGGKMRFAHAEVERLLREQMVTAPVEDDRRMESRYSFCVPVLVRVGEGAMAYSCNAVVSDISAHGIGLVAFDNNGLAARLASGDASEVTVLNLPEGLFKDIVVGHVQHHHPIGNRQIAVGVTLD